MAEDLVDRVLREVRERKKHAQAAWEESRRLEAAVRALKGEGTRVQPPRPTARTRLRPPRKRSPRGQTRDAILRVVAERPGATAAEIATAANLDRRVTQSTLARLARQGQIERFTLPGGGTAYRPPSPTRDSDPTHAISPPPDARNEREPDAPATAGETALGR